MKLLKGKGDQLVFKFCLFCSQIATKSKPSDKDDPPVKFFILLLVISRTVHPALFRLEFVGFNNYTLTIIKNKHAEASHFFISLTVKHILKLNFSLLKKEI